MSKNRTSCSQLSRLLRKLVEYENECMDKSFS